jgi:hypothetical protein
MSTNVTLEIVESDYVLTLSNTTGVTVEMQDNPAPQMIDVAVGGLPGPKGDTGDPGPSNITAATQSTLTGILKGTGTLVAVATPGTDYQVPLGFTAENTANKGVGSGYCPLDSDAYVPDANISPVVRRPSHIGFETIPTITSNGNGTVTVTAAEVTFYTDAAKSNVQTRTVNETICTLLNDQTTYIVADRTTLEYAVLSTMADIDYERYIPLADLYKRTGSTAVHTQPNQLDGRILAEKVYKRLIATARYARETGLDGIAMAGTYMLHIRNLISRPLPLPRADFCRIMSQVFGR